MFGEVPLPLFQSVGDQMEYITEMVQHQFFIHLNITSGWLGVKHQVTYLLSVFGLFSGRKIEKLDTEDLDEIEKIGSWGAEMGMHPLQSLEILFCDICPKSVWLGAADHSSRSSRWCSNPKHFGNIKHRFAHHPCDSLLQRCLWEALTDCVSWGLVVSQNNHASCTEAECNITITPS